MRGKQKENINDSLLLIGSYGGHYNPNKALFDCVQLTWSNMLTKCITLCLKVRIKPVIIRLVEAEASCCLVISGHDEGRWAHTWSNVNDSLQHDKTIILTLLSHGLCQGGQWYWSCLVKDIMVKSYRRKTSPLSYYAQYNCVL